MPSLTSSIASIATLAACAGVPAQSPRRAAALVIRHVAVVDVEHGVLDRDRTVTIIGSRISSIARTLANDGRAGASTIDGSGGFLIPGLWDMAAYVLNYRAKCNPAALELYVAHGVTGVRDIGTNIPMAAIRAMKDSIRRGLVTGPRLLVAGPGLGGASDGFYPTISIPTRTAAAVRRQVDSLAAEGVDYIKLYQYLPKALLPVALDAARAHHLWASGALAWGFKEAAEAGLRVIDHPADLRRSVSYDRALYARRYEGETRAGADSLSARELAQLRGAAVLDTITDPLKRDYAWTGELVRNRDTSYYRATLETLRRLGVHIVTNTADYAESLQRFEFTDPARAEFRTRADNRALFKAVVTGRPIVDYETYARGVRGSRELWSDLHAAHVPVAAGTQVSCMARNTPGLTISDELTWASEGGWTPVEALRTATLESARLLNATDSLGTVAPGHVADLVLLDGDPLIDVRNVQRVRAVVLNGKYLDRTMLNALVERGRAAVRGK